MIVIVHPGSRQVRTYTGSMLGHIDTSLIDWSRAQFALTAIYHWIFVPLTLGLAIIMGIMELPLP